MKNKAEKDFPKFEAGRLALAAQRVLRASGAELGEAMQDLQDALREYDDRIIALVHWPKRA